MATCDWPGCTKPATDELPLQPGMDLTIDGVRFDGSAFAVCSTHAPEIGRIGLDAIDDALRRDAARRNLAPGDVEWETYFGEDR